MKKDLRNTDKTEIQEWLKDKKEPAFRASQIDHWLWTQPVSDILEMSNLSKTLREALDAEFYLNKLELVHQSEAKDGTLKMAYKLDDDRHVEGVLIPSKSRITACISTQIGCKMGCRFCATGKMGFGRDLTAGEIYMQAWHLNAVSEKKFGSKLSNLVVMGMGEPLDNFQNSMRAINKIMAKNGMGMSHRRITLSTAGLVPEIKKLADTDADVHLSVSLHAANDELRSKLMPINRKYGLKTLAESLQYYHEKTKKRISYEYVLLKGINDSLENAAELAEFTKISPCKINLIEYNPVEGTGYGKSDEKNTQAFMAFLEKRNLIVNLRRSRGKDVDAACGQLANKF
ncbi:MAG: 23S rRNA (adenine(2503)-C(2))-methyltransferase RlmN [Bacteroidales bacterium]